MNILERQHNGLELVGVTANNPIQLARNDTMVPFLPFTEIDEKNYDVLLVVGARQIGMSRITQAARQLHLSEEKLLGDWIVCIPGFTVDKYRRLQRSRLSIFSINCFGGHISHTFGLPFLSPFVNLTLDEQHFIKFLRAPRVYIEEEPHFEKLTETSYEPHHYYPIFSIGNVSLRMLHYKEANDAFNKWNNRKHRINWFNLFVTMCTENKEILEQFNELPYDKKVCFVPFKSNLDSAWYINPEIDKRPFNFSNKCIQFGIGNPLYYDPFDMLLYGKKTPLIDM